MTYKFTWALVQKSSYKHFTEYTHNKTGRVILDVGTGTGEYIKALGRNNKYIFTDIDAKMLEKAQKSAERHLKEKNWSIEVVDANDIKSHNRADVISMLHVISLMTDPRKLISHAMNNLNQDGELLIYVSQYPKNMRFIYNTIMRILRCNPIKVEQILSPFKFSKERVGLFNYCYTVRK